MAFQVTSPALIHCGAGVFDRIPEEAARLGRRAAVVTGGHLHGGDRVSDLLERLRAAGVDASASAPITTEPTVDAVDQLAGFFREVRADLVIAIGGGSVMDAAKAAALMARNDGITEDYQLKRREIANPPLAQIAVPTTAGTGSEATRVSVLTNNRVGVKRSISHALMTPNIVVLDPELTVSCPLRLTTTTAMDAFAHAIESAVSKDASAYTRHVALAGVEQLALGLPGCQVNPCDLDARLECLMGACWAGLAMQNGLGASHSLAPAACIVSGASHSEVVAALLPHVIRLNKGREPLAYADVEKAMGCEDVAGRIEALCASGGFNCSIAQFGLKPSDWPQVHEVMDRYASHRLTNPVEVTEDYAHEIYELSVTG